MSESFGLTNEQIHRIAGEVIAERNVPSCPACGPWRTDEPPRDRKWKTALFKPDCYATINCDAFGWYNGSVLDEKKGTTRYLDLRNLIAWAAINPYEVYR